MRCLPLQRSPHWNVQVMPSMSNERLVCLRTKDGPVRAQSASRRTWAVVARTRARSRTWLILWLCLGSYIGSGLAHGFEQTFEKKIQVTPPSVAVIGGCVSAAVGVGGWVGGGWGWSRCSAINALARAGLGRVGVTSNRHGQWVRRQRCSASDMRHVSMAAHPIL